MDPYSAADAVAKAHMREALAYLGEAHQQEVRQLREKVQQLASSLKKVHTVALCARIDEPDMESVTEEVAAELAFSMPYLQDMPPVRSPRSPRAPLTANADGTVVTPRRSACNNHAGYMEAAPGFLEATLLAEVPMTSARRESKRHLPTVQIKDGDASTEMRTLRSGSRLSEGGDSVLKRREAEEIRRDMEKLVPEPRKRVHRIMRLKERRHPRTWREAAQSLRSIVEHPFFDSLCAVMIVLNSVLVGYEVEWKTTHESSELWVEYASQACSCFFLLELMVRVWVYQLDFYCGSDNILWNWFDTVLVIVSLVEFYMEISGSGGTNLGSPIKAVKMLRIARVFRVFRFFKELSLLALMIIDSMKSLMWASLMLSIILYVFAILFTQFATEHIKEHSSSSMEVAEVQRQFGNIPRTVYTLLQAMLGGVSWGVSSDALLTIHGAMAFLFFFYIFFTMLAFLNITTGVFVDNAVETARTQREFLVQKQTELKEKYTKEMRDLFMEMDEDGSGTVSLDEVNAYFEDPRVQSYFAALGLDYNDTEHLFSLLDCDDDGDVSVDEFLQGCLRLKGEARSIDVQHLLSEFKKFNKRMDIIFQSNGVSHRQTARASRKAPVL